MEKKCPLSLVGWLVHNTILVYKLHILFSCNMVQFVLYWYSCNVTFLLQMHVVFLCEIILKQGVL